MIPANKALLEVIQQFGPPNLTDLECALNTIRHHAAEINRLHKALDEIAELDSGRAQKIATRVFSVTGHDTRS